MDKIARQLSVYKLQHQYFYYVDNIDDRPYLFLGKFDIIS